MLQILCPWLHIPKSTHQKVWKDSKDIYASIRYYAENRVEISSKKVDAVTVKGIGINGWVEGIGHKFQYR
jgi:hypothetical protein